MFQDIVKAIPPINRETLKFLLQHLLRYVVNIILLYDIDS